MRAIRAFLFRLVNLFGKERRDRDLAEELESHLAMQIECNVRSGMTPREARRAALLKSGARPLRTPAGTAADFPGWKRPCGTSGTRRESSGEAPASRPLP